MRASDLCGNLKGAVLAGPDVEFAALRSESGRVRPGDAFIALKGSVTDGHRFIPDAVGRGAALVICSDRVTPPPAGVSVLCVPDTKAALETILDTLYPRARTLPLVGVTGTNGKTTTTYLVESVMANSGMRPGLIGTIEVRFGGARASSSLTTPGPVDLYELLHTMQERGMGACVMEVSSHALDQNRLPGVMFDCAVFTNLTQDHLDYHRDMESYFQAKKRLFTEHLRGRAVLNADDTYGRRLAAEMQDACTYGFGLQAHIHPTHLDISKDGISLLLSTPGGEIPLRSALKGRMNASNIMAAVGACLVMGLPPDAIEKGVSSLKGVPGRMEAVPNARGLMILVDYAHTPAALDAALTNARALTGGRLMVVFGCGGDRDRTKRPVMGSIAAARADVVFVTSDNPRSEDPMDIIRDIVSGVPGGANVVVEPDRARAIRTAIDTMNPQDCLVIAGKGHEDYQVVGVTRIPFDDRSCVRDHLGEAVP